MCGFLYLSPPLAAWEASPILTVRPSASLNRLGGFTAAPAAEPSPPVVWSPVLAHPARIIAARPMPLHLTELPVMFPLAMVIWLGVLSLTAEELAVACRLASKLYSFLSSLPRMDRGVFSCAP